MCSIFILPGTAAALFRPQKPKRVTYTRNIQKTIVREGTVEVPASPTQDTEAGIVKP